MSVETWLNHSVPHAARHTALVRGGQSGGGGLWFPLVMPGTATLLWCVNAAHHIEYRLLYLLRELTAVLLAAI